MLTFEKVRWKNILSTGNTFTEIKLNKSPNTLIVGENGAGKSTILDALCFGLYGRSLRKIKKDQLINSINQRDALVEVEFTSYGRKYKVVRGIKPAVFEIYQNDVLMNQTAAIKDYQEILERTILRMNLKSFTQIVILGRASFVPFMQLKAAERREVIEDLLDIRVFSTMGALLKEKIVNANHEYALTESESKSTAQMIRMQEENQARAERDTDKLVKEAKAAIKKAKARIVESQARVEQLLEETKIHDELAENGDELQDQMRELASLKKKLLGNIEKAEETIQFYHDNDHCPTCTQEISGDIKQSHIDKKSKSIQEFRDAISKVETKHAKFDEKRRAVMESLVEVTKKIKELNDFQAKINQDHREIELHNKHIEQLKSKVDTTTTDILIDLKTKLSNINIKLEQVTKTRALYEFAATILKDTGIKSRIIKQYVPVINTLVNKYLAAMDFFVKFELNENFEEKILSRHRDDFTYDSFSEGEKMRIDLALLFTWRTIARMKNSAATNLLVLDEVFDASLDTNGCEEFLKLIHSMENANVFVISHKGDILQDKFRSSIRFEKSNNFSRIATV